jgi:hypothetical protein
LIHKVEKALLEALVYAGCVLSEFDYKRPIVLSATASNKADNLRLIKDTIMSLVRLVCMLNKALETLSEDDKGELSNQVGCVY